MRSRSTFRVFSFVMLASVAVMFWQFVEQSENREQRRIEAQAQVMADAGSRELKALIDKQKDALLPISENDALKIYFLALQQQPNLSEPLPEMEYVQQLLSQAVKVAGLETSDSLAVIDAQGKIVASTQEMQALPNDWQSRMPTRGDSTPVTTVVNVSERGSQVLMALPIAQIQADAGVQTPMGYLVLSRNISAAKLVGMVPANAVFRLIPEENTITESTVAETSSVVRVLSHALVEVPLQVEVSIDRQDVLATLLPLKRLLGLALGVMTLLVMASNRALKKASSVSQFQQKNPHAQEHLVKALVDALDRRDPHAAAHSAKVAKVAVLTAKAMSLDPLMVETIETAARLCNIGKIELPEDLLTKKAALNESERMHIRNVIAKSADYVSDVPFAGPVVDTLRQTQEFVDGSGPLGLFGDEILISARIVAAANALVGMMSVRAYRSAMSADEASEKLYAMVGSQFDRRVVSRMVTQIENLAAMEESEGAEAA